GVGRGWPRSRRGAGMPSRWGMRVSLRATAGGGGSTAAVTPRPSSAPPATPIWFAPSGSLLRLGRGSGAASEVRTRGGACSGGPREKEEAAVQGGPVWEVAADEREPFGEPDQSGARRGRGGGGPAADDLDHEAGLVVAAHRHLYRAVRGVLPCVGQSFLDDAV